MLDHRFLNLDEPFFIVQKNIEEYLGTFTRHKKTTPVMNTICHHWISNPTMLQEHILPIFVANVIFLKQDISFYLFHHH